MKILIVGDFKHPMYAPAFARGFSELGCEVQTIKYNDYLYHNSWIGGILSRVQNRLHWGIKVYSYNSDIYKTVSNTSPDLVFLYRCYNIWPITIRRLRKAGHIIYTYNNDDPFSKCPSNFYYRYFHAIIPLANVNFVYRKKNIVDYSQIGSHFTQVLLPYYLSKDNYPLSINDDIPIAFIGHFENDGRDRYIKALLDAGVDVTVFNGSDWEKAPLYDSIKTTIEPEKRGMEYNITLNRCKIALVFLSKINNDTYTRRCFEIPATKTLMMAEYTDDLNRLFPGDECAVYFKSEEELVSKCQSLLSNPSEIQRIANNGYERVKFIGGSEIDRCKEILNTYNNNGKIIDFNLYSEL